MQRTCELFSLLHTAQSVQLCLLMVLLVCLRPPDGWLLISNIVSLSHDGIHCKLAALQVKWAALQRLDRWLCPKHKWCRSRTGPMWRVQRATYRGATKRTAISAACASIAVALCYCPALVMTLSRFGTASIYRQAVLWALSI